LRDRKAKKQECNEQILKLSVSLNKWIHGSSFHISFARTSLSLAVTLRKEGQVELRGRRLNNLARVRFWQTATKSVNAIFVESPFPVQQTQSAFHPHARRNAFRRRDARQQSRLFARENPQLQHSPTPTGLAEIVSDGFPVRGSFRGVGAGGGSSRRSCSDRLVVGCTAPQQDAWTVAP
jgi:hypothetical protein